VETNATEVVERSNNKNLGADWAGKRGIIVIPVGISVGCDWLAYVVSIGIKTANSHHALFPCIWPLQLATSFIAERRRDMLRLIC
jgi:hypothetical protein